MLKNNKYFGILKQFYEEIKVPTLLSIAVTVCCYLSFVPLIKDVGYSVCIVTCLLSYISSRFFSITFRYAQNVIDSWWKRILAVILFIYFNISLYGVVYLENDGMNGFAFNELFYPIVALVWVTPIFFALFYVVAKVLSYSTRPKTKLSIKIKVLLFVVLILNYCIWIYAFNPCITSSDSAYLFSQAHKMLEIPMNNWHPPFYAIILSLLLKIYDSATFIVALQCIAYSILLIRIIDYLWKLGCSKTICGIIYLLLGFAFNNVIQMITLWKDIPYMISILWLSFLLAQFIQKKCEITLSWYIRFVVAMVCTALFRQNGIMPIIAVAIFISALFIIKKKYLALVSIATVVVIIVLIQGPLYSFYNVQSKPGLKYFALANDIVGTYYVSDESSDEVMEIVSEITEGEPDTFEYNPYYTKYNRNALGEYSAPRFVFIYGKTFFEHPKALTLQFMRRNSVLWSVLRPRNEKSGCINYLAEYHSEEFDDYTYPYRISNSFTSLLSKYSDVLTGNSLIDVFAWRTGIYTVVLLFMILYIVCKKRFLELIVFVPIIFNEIALYISSGWPDYRYYWPTEVITLFIIPFMYCYFNANVSEKNNQSEQGKGGEPLYSDKSR